MKFDSNAAWNEASAAISANREVLLAMAGVFFLLPSLAFALLYPQPEPTAAMDNKAMMAMLSDYYVAASPAIIPMVLLQAVGTLAMLTMLTDRARPTVGQAIRRGASALVPYFLAQIIFGIGVGVVGGTILAIASATGAAALIALAFAVILALAIYLGIRTALVAPVVAVEGERNPVAALRRSWRLTEGNALRIAVFFVLVAVAFGIVMLIVTGLLGAMVTLLAGPDAGKLAGTVLSSAIGAVMTAYFVAILTAVHRQLAGPSAQTIGARFE